MQLDSARLITRHASHAISLIERVQTQQHRGGPHACKESLQGHLCCNFLAVWSIIYAICQMLWPLCDEFCSCACCVHSLTLLV